MIDLLKEIQGICIMALESEEKDIKKELKNCKKDIKAILKLINKIGV